MDVRIYALGEGRDGRMFDYGWITSGESRRRVWEMRYDDTERAGGDPKNRLFDGTVHLDKGSYIVHYISDDSHSAGDWNASAPPDGAHWGITVLSAKGPLDKSAIGPYAENGDPSIVAQITEVRDDQHLRKRFTLDRETDVRIYALGEATDDDMADYGWIEDARSGRPRVGNDLPHDRAGGRRGEEPPVRRHGKAAGRRGTCCTMKRTARIPSATGTRTRRMSPRCGVLLSIAAADAAGAPLTADCRLQTAD